MDAKMKLEMEIYAAKVRIGLLEELEALGFGHVGGSLSIADLLGVLYGGVMRVDTADPKWPQRDKLVSSKGHAGPAVYAALAVKGFFPYEEILTLNQPGTNFPSHCDMKKTRGVDMTTGSLGQGASAACGLALADKLKGHDSRTFLIVGDGELNEGQVWEAAMFASAKKLDNIVWCIDVNGKQLDGTTEEIHPVGMIADKFRAFGFDTHEINGGDVEEIYNAVTAPVVEGMPRALVMHTVKGAGVPEVEQTAGNHSMNLPKETWRSFITAMQEKLAALEKEAQA